MGFQIRNIFCAAAKIQKKDNKKKIHKKNNTQRKNTVVGITRKRNEPKKKTQA
ncbi:unnamed protein product, partial [Diamesa tonsa]